ncbi:MAG: BadF/BadG/BcrA/BcrD ATPase family protein [Thermoplasmata archaeon]
MILSLDGGATKTVAVVLDDDNNQIRGVGVSGPANLIAISKEVAESNIMKAVNDALDDASISIRGLKAGIFGLSGMGDSRELDNEGVKLVHRLTSREDFFVVNDGLPAFALAHMERDGIVFAGGTGSVAYYRLHGTTRRIGGWNWFVGDDGSAAWIAKRALNIATLEYDGIYPEREIVDEVEKYFGLEFREAIAFVDKHQDKRLVSGFAPRVSQLAKSGYARAAGIMKESAEYVSGVVIALSKKFSSQPEISLIGGTMQAGKAYTSLIEKKTGCRMKIFYGYQVAIGGLITLLINNGIQVTESLRDNMVEQMDNILRRKGRKYWGEFINVD